MSIRCQPDVNRVSVLPILCQSIPIRCQYIANSMPNNPIQSYANSVPIHKQYTDPNPILFNWLWTVQTNLWHTIMQPNTSPVRQSKPICQYLTNSVCRSSSTWLIHRTIGHTENTTPIQCQTNANPMPIWISSLLLITESTNPLLMMC